MPCSAFTDQPGEVFTHVRISLCLLIPLKGKKERKMQLFIIQTILGKKESRAFTKNSHCGVIRPHHAAQIPNELCPFPYFLFRHLGPAPKCIIAFGFLQPTQLPCKAPQLTAAPFYFTGEGTDPKVVTSLKTPHPVPPSTTPSHPSPSRALQSFPLSRSF